MGGLWTNPTLTQVLSPRTTTSWRPMSSPSQSSLTHPQFSEQRFLEDVDYDDAALEEMLYNARRGTCLSLPVRRLVCWFSRRRPCPKRTVRPVVERTGRPVVERGQEPNTEHAQIRTLLDRPREQILAECQAEIKKHEFQANYDRRSIHKLKRNC